MPIVYATLIILLIYASLTDVSQRKIPNWLCGFIFIAGMIANSFLVTPTGFYNSLAGFVAGFLPFLLLHRLTGLGAGDVKLMASVGATVGFRPSLNILYCSFLASSLFAIGFVVVRFAVNRFDRRPARPPGPPSALGSTARTLAEYPFPMAPGIAAATAYVLMPELVSFFGDYDRYP
ncbi:MAG: A24 family peptidase [Methylococcaceae bacterium]|nr:A24 family peptidase [Methylococcaceae bacterium]